MGGLNKIVVNVKGVAKTQSESLVALLLIIVTWLLGFVSGTIKLLFSALEYPFNELLDYQQDHLEKGVKEEVDKSNSVKVLQRISSFLGSTEDESNKEVMCQSSGGEAQKQVSIPIKNDQSKNQSEQSINGKLESEAQTSTKKHRKSRRKSKKRGEKAHHLSAYTTSHHTAEKRAIEDKPELNVITHEIINHSKNKAQFVSIDPQTAMQTPNLEVEELQSQNLQLDSPPESPTSVDFEPPVFDEAAQRDLFMKPYQHSQPSQKIVAYSPQPVEQIPQISHVNSQIAESNVVMYEKQNVVEKSEEVHNVQPNFMNRVFQKSQKVPQVNEQPAYLPMQKFAPTYAQTHLQYVKEPKVKSKCDDFEMEELLSHIEVVRMKSQVDPEAIDWYHKNIQILNSIDINSLVKKLHT